MLLPVTYSKVRDRFYHVGMLLPECCTGADLLALWVLINGLYRVSGDMRRRNLRRSLHQNRKTVWTQS